MPSRRGELRHYLKGALLLMTLAACGRSTGCSGCDTEGERFPQKDRVHSAVQLRLTEPGLSFLEQSLEPLLAQALPEEGLSLCLPGTGGRTIGVEYGYCQAEVCDGAPGCRLNIAIGAVQLLAIEPNILRSVITFDELDARIDIAARPIISCALEINAPGFPVQVDLELTTPMPTRDLTFQIADAQYRLADLNIDLVGDGNGFLDPLCDAVGAAINLPIISDLMYDAIQFFLDDILIQQVNGFVADFTCAKCEDDADCPGAGPGRCQDGVCMAGDICIPAPLGVEGSLDVGALLASFSPGLEATIQYVATPGSYVEVENQGLSMGIISGALAEGSRCVPPRPQPPVVEPARSVVLRGNVTPTGEEYEVGIGITTEILDHAMWAFFNSGALCLSVTSGQIAQLSQIALLLPNIRKLTRGNPQLAMTISPQEIPQLIIGENSTRPDPENPGQFLLDDPLVTMLIPDLWVDFHAFIDGRWTRIFSLRSDISVPIGVGFTPDNGLIPVLGDLTGAVSDLVTANGEIMLDDAARFEQLLPALIGPLLSTATAGLTDPIVLPDIIGYRLNMQDGSLTGIEENRLLAVFANLERSPDVNNGMGAAFSVDTRAEIIEVQTPPAERLDLTRNAVAERATVLLKVEAFDGTDDDAEMEYSWKVGDLSWSLFAPADELLIRSPMFLLQGKHEILVRARRVDDYQTLDPSPARVVALIDSVAPELRLVDDGGLVRVEVRDGVSAQDELALEVRLDGGDWIPLGALTISPEGAELVEVRATDEAGNVSAAQIQVSESALIGRVDPSIPVDPEGGGCGGCSVGEASAPSGTSWLLALFPLALLGLRRRRRLSGVLLIFALALLALGCDDSASGNEGDDTDATVRQGCQTDDDCSANLVCEDGECVAKTCKDDPAVCEALSCDSGEPASCNDENICQCEPFCPEGCGDTEFCCLATNSCAALPSACDGFMCPPGLRVNVTRDGQVDPNTCTITNVECGCVELDPLPAGSIGRFSDFTVVGNTPWFSASAELYGDLVVGTEDPILGWQWQWVDGVPEGEVVAGPSGPRGGVDGAGPNVGEYTSIVAAADGTLHVAYYDVDNKDLKYALGTPEGRSYTWVTRVLDTAGDSGRYASISVDARGVPGVSYRSAGIANGAGFVTEARYILAKNATPDGDADWNAPFTVHQVATEAEDADTGIYPEGTGLFTSHTRDLNGQPIMAWYDRAAGAMNVARFNGDGFDAPEMLAGWGYAVDARNGDMGANVDLTLDPEGNLHLCYQDGMTDSLRYLAPELGFDEWVDDGRRVDQDGRENALHVVGEDCAVRVASEGRVVIVYQDATSHNLLKATRDAAGNWTRVTIRGDEQTYAGAFGFYATAEIVGESVWISNYVYRHQLEVPIQELEFIREQL